MSDASARTAVIIDEHPLWLEALERLLVRLDINVVGRAANAAQATNIIGENPPDLVVTDASALGELPDGRTILGVAREANANVRCVVLSETDEPTERDQAFAVGADVYGLKRSEPDDVASAIRQSFDRSIYHAQGYPGRSEAPLQLVTSYDRPTHGLTNRELEILRLVADGHSNSQLARMLWVTEQTIKFHLSNIYRKLGVANRTEASRWAQLNGVLEERLEEAIA